MDKNNQAKKGYMLIFTGGMMWGTIGYFVSSLKFLGVSSLLAAFIRIGFGSLFFIPLVYFIYGKKAFIIDKRGFLYAALMGIICQALFNFAYNTSINEIGVATASILLYTSPVFVCIMARVFFKEKIKKIIYLALSLNVVGCILTITNGDFSGLNVSIFGLAMGLCAGFSYATVTILGKVISNKGYNEISITFYSFIVGAIILGIMAKPYEVFGSLVSFNFILLCLGFGLIPAAGAYYVYMKGLAKPVEASKVPVVASVETVVAAIIGIMIFKENFGFVMFIGIGCVLLSILIISKSKK